MTEINPYFEDDRVRLFGVDSIRVLHELDANSVDALITDPPYSSGGMTRADRSASTRAKYVSSDAQNAAPSFAGDNRDQHGFAYWMHLWLSEAMVCLKEGAVVGLFSDWRQLPTVTDVLQGAGYVYRGIVPWAKPSYRPMAGRFAAQCEYLIWGSKGSMGLDFTKPVLPGFFEANTPSASKREHQTQKPLDVMRKLVRICPEGGVVLDPFMGSGTTGVAAINEGRRFIGCELVPAYQQISERRIKEAEGRAVPQGEQAAFDLTTEEVSE